ncbi:hypothetical protein M5W62_21660, partial [Paenibacillus larvae]|nr:hypothetical protein [Paenibacillus larvae]
PIPGAKQGGKYLTKGTIELEEQLEKSLVSAGISKYRLPMDLQLFAGKGKGIEINNSVLDNVRIGSALKKDAQHAFNEIIDNYAGHAKSFDIVGGDGVKRNLYQIEGSLNGKEGVFEWIIDPDPRKGVTHRRFIEGVGVTGKPNARPKR